MGNPVYTEDTPRTTRAPSLPQTQETPLRKGRFLEANLSHGVLHLRHQPNHLPNIHHPNRSDSGQQPADRGSNDDWNTDCCCSAKPENICRHILLEQYYDARSDNPRSKREQAASLDEDRGEQAKPENHQHSDDHTVTEQLMG